MSDVKLENIPRSGIFLDMDMMRVLVTYLTALFFCIVGNSGGFLKYISFFFQYELST